MAELSVLLILDRRADSPVALHEVTQDETLRQLLSQNMSDLQDADAAFARMSALMSKITCLRLVYSDLEDAVTFLREAFGSEETVAPGTWIGPAIQSSIPEDLPVSQSDPAIIWARDTDIMLQTKGDSTFLWKPGQTRIWHMNALGHAVWAMLEIPGSASEIGQVLAGQFPNEDETKIIDDVNALLKALAKAGMIVRV